MFGGGVKTLTYYSVKLWDAAKNSTDVVQYTERVFAEFLSSSDQHLLLPKMNKDRRAIIHELAQFYGIQTTSLPGPPDKKSVDLSKTAATHIPSPKLSEAIKNDELDPRKLLKDAELFPNRVLVFDDCSEAQFPSIYYAIRNHIGSFVLSFDGKKESIAVFTNEKLLSEAYSTLRRNGTLPIAFHYVGRAPPPRSTTSAHADPKAPPSANPQKKKINYDKEVGKPKPKQTNQNRFSGLGGI
jgi:hypothetical protein